jgi:hypothetical protein
MIERLYAILSIFGSEKRPLICGVCKTAIPSYRRKEHLMEFHEIDSRLVDWIIMTEDGLISLKTEIKRSF